LQSPLRGRQHRGAIASNAARAIDRGEEIGDPRERSRCFESHGRLLDIGEGTAESSGVRCRDRAHEVVCGKGAHQILREIGYDGERVRSGEIEGGAEISQIAQVNGLDRHRSLDLPGEAALPARVRAVADDQDLCLARRVHSGGGCPHRTPPPPSDVPPPAAVGGGRRSAGPPRR